MKAINRMTLAELAAFVQDHLRGADIDTVLSGGACVAVYTRGKYVSMDLDLIHTSLMAPKRAKIREVMQDLGFSERGRHFEHPESDIIVEFPQGPPAVGEEPVKEVHKRRVATGILKIISPTDCVKDRLTWYYHDNDLQCLEQAVLVAQSNPVDMNEIERWSAGEGRKADFTKIRSKLKHRQS